MDKARRIGGIVWVSGGLIYQFAWWAWGGMTPGPITTALIAIVTVAAVCVVWRPRGRLTRWIGWVTVAALAVDLAGAVGDRFGLLGRPGESGVSWGDWTHFVAYTATLLHDPSHGIAVSAAVAATIAELALALWLLSGRHRRYAGKAVAGVLTIYLVAMASSVGFGQVARYAVPVLIGGALIASAIPPRKCPVSADEVRVQPAPVSKG